MRWRIHDLLRYGTCAVLLLLVFFRMTHHIILIYKQFNIHKDEMHFSISSIFL